MISTFWTSAASTDLLVPGDVDVCADALVMAGPAALHECTGLPAAGTGSSRVAAALDRRPKSPDTTGRFLAPAYLPQNDGTTLGIRSPGRPLS